MAAKTARAVVDLKTGAIRVEGVMATSKRSRVPRSVMTRTYKTRSEAAVTHGTLR